MKARLFLLVAFLVPSTLLAQVVPVAEGYILFKDGFTIHGKIMQQKEFLSDPASGVVVSITAPGSMTFLDDEVRRIYFPPGQIADVVKLKTGELSKDEVRLARTGPMYPQKPLLLPAWRFEAMVPFDKEWNRELKVVTQSSFPLKQRIVQLTPQRMRIQSMSPHAWEMNYFTKELLFSDVTKYVTDYQSTHSSFAKLTKEDKSFTLARFYQQMGRLEEAEAIAKELLVAIPEHKKKIEDFLDDLDRDKVKKFTADFEPLANAKQHRALLERLAIYDRGKLADKAPEKSKLFAQELKNKYEAETEKLEKTKSLFKFLMSKSPEPRGFWLQGTDTILQELNYDTLPRLDTFLTYAEQYQREAAQGMTPKMRVENVLALAITGWHLGTIAAEPDIELAQKLWKGRKLLPEYMKIDTAGQRALRAETWAKETNLPIDVVARMLLNLPPPNAYPKIGREVMTLDLDLPDSPTGSYLIQLPPDYNHSRPHPVLMLVHGPEAPDILLKRWTPHAARHGFILVAPLFTKVSKDNYRFSDREHTYFMNCLKDLKRRFQVDTDRVFLFGWSGGGQVAWDIGLAHPDQFAGVLPMCGVPEYYTKTYWPNAQNLGLYIVDGDKSGSGPSKTREMFKDWIRCNYNAYYLEYKGRSSELYVGEFEPMIEWMSRKKRQYPTRVLGTFSATGGAAEEFRSLRQSDNRFYWLSSDELNEANTQDWMNWVKGRQPAPFQGTISVINNADAKGNAVIKTEVALRVQGLKQCTVWLAPHMADLTKPVQIRINGRVVGPLRTVTSSIPTLLEEYYLNADRQRLYHARIDLKL